MDRRQRKTREAIFAAFTSLLSNKDFTKITVGEIIEGADVCFIRIDDEFKYFLCKVI